VAIDLRPQRGSQKSSTAVSAFANSPVVPRFYEFDDFLIDVQRRMLLHRGVAVSIKPKALDTLVLLIVCRDRVVDKDELMTRLWPDTAVEEANLTQNIFVVRKALGEAPGQQRFIATFARRGYRFVADVLEHSEEPRDVPEQGAPVTPAQRPRHRRAIASGGALLLGLAALSSALLHRPVSSVVEPIRAIAVLPFQSFSADSNERYFAQGMTDAVIADLASISALRVTSRQSVIRFDGSTQPLPDIARALGVDAIIEGSVGRSKDRIRLTVNLVDGRTDRHLWTATYDRASGDILALQGELAQAVAGAVRVSLTAPEETALLRRRPVDPEAYDLYLRGRYFFNLRTQAAVWKSLDLYQQAVDRDPAFAGAHAAIALSSVLAGEFIPPQEVAARVKLAAERALELDPGQVDAQVALALTGPLDRDSAEKVRDWQRILERNPNHVTGHLWYGSVLEDLGRPEEALVERRRTVALDPLSPIANLSLGTTLAQLGHDDEAIRSLRRALEIQPDYADAHGWLGWIYLKAGRRAEGLAELELCARPGDQPRLMARYAHALGLVGRSDEARKLLHAMERQARERYVSPIYFAHVYAGLGERDLAFARLEEAHRQGGVQLRRIKSDPLLQPLHDDARFESLVRRLHLPWP